MLFAKQALSGFPGSLKIISEFYHKFIPRSFWKRVNLPERYRFYGLFLSFTNFSYRIKSDIEKLKI